MSGPSCELQHQIRELIHGRPSLLKYDTLEEHLRVCPACQVELEALDNLPDAFVSTVRTLLDPSLIRSNDQLRAALNRFKPGPNDPTMSLPGGDALPQIFGGNFGDFRIIRELGRGGMGIVYEAEQLSLGRRVALKTLPFAALLDPRQLQRFQNEARAVASLEHPNIVSVYGVGVERGVHYYAMRYIDGRNLAQILEQLRQQNPAGPTKNPTRPTRDDSTQCGESKAANWLSSHALTNSDYMRAIARIGVQAAEALDYAHERGIVHRDVKPSNLMLDQTGHLWVADFGLARVDTDPTLSASGAILGTLRYMSPEQALGKRGVVDHRSDIYSLGVTLYELLTRTPIFPEAERATLISRIATQEPIVPRRLNPGIPADLETVVLTAMAKNAVDRYDTAGALGADLQRFLEQKPILARPVGRATRALKWARRRPAVAALLAVSAVAVLVLLVGGWWHAATLRSALTVTERLRQEADQQRLEADAQRQAALSQQAIAGDRERRVRRYLYAADIRLAWAAWKNIHLKEAVEFLSRHVPEGEEEDLRTFAWHYLWRLCHTELLTLHGHSGRVYGVAYSPDGKMLATASADGTAKLWDAGTGHELATLKGHGHGEVNAVVFSPDGKTLATCGDDRTVRIWDVETRRLRATCQGHTEDVLVVDFSPDGKTLASGGVDRLIKLWDPVTGRERMTLRGHDRWIRGLAFSPDSSHLASACSEGKCRVWELKTGATQTIFNGHFDPSPITKAGPDLYCVAFAHDGRSVASGAGNRLIKIWDPATGIEKATLAGHSEAVRRVEFSLDDRLLVAALADGNVWFWDVATGTVRNKIRGHTEMVWSAALAPDGRRVATASSDRTVKVWDVDTRQERQTFAQFPSRHTISGVRFSPDGTQLVSFGSIMQPPTLRSWKLRIWEVKTGREYTQFRHDGLGVFFGPAANGNGLMMDRPGPADRRIYEYAVPDEWHFAPCLEFRGPDFLSARTLFGDGRSMAGVDPQGVLRVWDLPSGQPRLKTEPLFKDVRVMAPSPDGRFLAIADGSGAATLWDLAANKPRARLAGHPGAIIRRMAFSSDGTRLATAGGDRTIRIWNLPTGAEEATLIGHDDIVFGLAFSPDSLTLASGGDEGMVKLWDMRTFQELISFDAQKGGVQGLAFSPGGKLLVSGGGPLRESGGKILLWSAALDQDGSSTP